MSQNSDNQLVIAVSSRALFDLEEENRIFEQQGIEAYRAYQKEHVDEALRPGVAFAFVKRLLLLNQRFGDLEPFRVVVLSRNSPETGQRFFESCRHYDLPIKAGVFTSGFPTLPYIDCFDVSLFLSANAQSVKKALRQGLPAGLVLAGDVQPREDDEESMELRIAFDFDGVIVDDESERHFQRAGLDSFNEHEEQQANVPHAPGPLQKLFTKLAKFQAMDEERGKNDPSYRPVIRVSIVTSRGAQTERRLLTTLDSLGIQAAELFLLDGMKKEKILQTLKPHIFFDDQLRHLEQTAGLIPSVLIPFGVRNDG